MRTTIIISVLMIGIIVSLSFASAVQTYWSDAGFVIEFEVALPATMITALLGYDGVVDAYTEGGISIIILEENFANDVGGEQIKNYLDLIELQVKNNKASTALTPDGLPPPICMLDINGNKNGLYSVNNELYIQVNDQRCA